MDIDGLNFCFYHWQTWREAPAAIGENNCSVPRAFAALAGRGSFLSVATTAWIAFHRASGLWISKPRITTLRGSRMVGHNQMDQQPRKTPKPDKMMWIRLPEELVA